VSSNKQKTQIKSDKYFWPGEMRVLREQKASGAAFADMAEQ